MSLPRQEARFFLDHDDHTYLKTICAVRGITIAHFVESLVVPEVKRLVHEANLIAAALEATGKVRRLTESDVIALHKKGNSDEGTG